MNLVFFRAVVFFSAIILYLVYEMTDMGWLEPFLSVLSIAAIALSFASIRLPSKGLTLLFLGSGTWLLVKAGADFWSYMMAYGEMLSLLSMFTVIPLLTLPIKIGGYEQAIRDMIAAAGRTEFHLYRTITSLSFLLGIFLNMATLPFMNSSVRSAVSGFVAEAPQKFLAQSVIHGYSLSLIWTPMSGIVSVVFDMTGAKWFRLFPLLLAMVFCCFMMNWVLFWLGEKWRRSDKRKQGTNVLGDHSHMALRSDRSSQKAIFQILLAIVLLITLIMGCGELFSITLVFAVTLLSLPAAWIWSLLLGKNAPFWQEVKLHFKEQVPKMTEMFSIFLSAGFFVKAMQISGTDVRFNELFTDLSQWMGPVLFMLALPVITLMFSAVGLHPTVTVMLLAQSLTPALLGISAEKIATALLGGSLIGIAIAPYSGTVTLMSVLIQESIFRISRWNLMQAISWFFVFAAFLPFV